MRVARPLAGVVEQVADQVGEVLRFAAKAQAVGRSTRRRARVRVDLVEGARRALDDRLHLRRGAGRSGARRRAGAVEVEADLAAHHAGLLAHFFGERRAARIRLVDRTLSGVFSACARLPTWVRARSTTSRLASSSRLTSAASGATSCGKLARDPHRFAAADRRQPLAQRAQRPQSEPHRQRGRADQRHREGEEGRRERIFEILDLRLDHVGVGGDLDKEAPVVARVNLALDHAQRLVAGADRVAAAWLRASFAAPSRLGNWVPNSEREVRISGMRHVEPGDLPVPAGKGSSNCGAITGGAPPRARLRRGEIGDQRLHVDAELPSKLASLQRALSAERPRPATTRIKVLQNAAEMNSREAIDWALSALRTAASPKPPRLSQAVSGRPCVWRPPPPRARSRSRARARSG